MSQLAISREPVPAKQSDLDQRRQSLRLVKPGTREAADRQQQRQAFAGRCEDIAWRLATSSFDERIAVYAAGAVTCHELSTAAALRPDLMPTINGEFEWIALSMADLD